MNKYEIERIYYSKGAVLDINTFLVIQVYPVVYCYWSSLARFNLCRVFQRTCAQKFVATLRFAYLQIL